ncbi:hypothetical protein A3Q56_00191 [Intoshia linei]|uniref:Uncharacterized protein n=1 Tax=Intoshia linei TaxID=1819745 RepID=A0A177BEM5_9BILA|nr:hypothetical protein A3Q56_00191 [Intoshia linei]
MKLSIISALLCYMLKLALSENMPILFFPGFGGSKLDNTLKDAKLSCFGRMDAIVDLSTLKIRRTELFHTFYNFFLLRQYENGIDIAAAPYDFRKIPNDAYYDKVGELIEKMYNVSKKKVTIVAHSFGTIVALYFLNHKSQKWKNDHIKLYIPISGPFSGSVKTIKGMLLGDSFGIFYTKPEQWKKLETSWNVPIAAAPSTTKWKSQEPFVLTKNKNYTINNMDELLTSVNIPYGLNRWKAVKSLVNDLKEPQVDTLCFYGGGLYTIKQLDYRHTDYPHGKPKLYYEKADGTVNYESLTRCTKWSKSKYFRYHQQFDQNTHVGILHNKEMIKLIYDHMYRDHPRPSIIIVKPETINIFSS